MKITTAENGKKIIEIESWEEVGLKIVIPPMTPVTSADELTSALRKIPIDIALKSDAAAEVVGLDVIAKVIITPVYCPHGKPDSINFQVQSDETPIDMSFLIYPADDNFNCDEEIKEDEAS